MYKTIAGLVTGLVVGISFGATVVAPRLEPVLPDTPDPSIRSSSSSVDLATNPEGDGSVQAAKGTSFPATLPEQITQPQQMNVSRPGLEKPIIWNMASLFAANLPAHRAQALSLEKNIQQFTTGSIKINLHEPGALVANHEEYSAVRSGSIEAVFGYSGANRVNSPALGLFSAFPFSPAPNEILAWMRHGGGEKIYIDLNHKAKVHGIICGIAPSESGGWSTKKIETTDSIKGLRIRATGFAATVMESLGATVSEISPNDIGAAFKSGLIDSAMFAEPTADLALGLNNFAAYYYFPGWQKPSTLLELLINLQKWQALTPEQQTAITTVCEYNLQSGLVEADALQFQALKKISAEGVTLLRWPEPVLSAFKNTWQQIARKLTAENADFRKTWNSLHDFREEYSIWQELKEQPPFIP